MRLLIGLIAALFLSVPATAKKPDWNRTVAISAGGGYVVGNPAAKVKVIEYLSLTCPHCRHFAETAWPLLRKDYVAKGLVSLEIRNFVLNGPDLAASLLMRCGTPAQAVRLLEDVFAEQDALFQPLLSLPEDARERITSAPAASQPLVMAREGGMDRWFVTRGIKPAQAATCLASEKAQERLIAIRNDGNKNYGISGTPGFVVNGQQVNGATWEQLEPAIKAALAAGKAGS